MGLKLAADFDLELFMSRLSEKLDDQQKALERYLGKPRANLRQLFGVAVGTGQTRVVVDLGTPAGGMIWSLQQLVVCTTDPFTTGTSVTAAIFCGGIPSGTAGGAAVDMGSLVAAGLAPPANYQAGGKSVVAHDKQHIYVVFNGTGVTNFGQIFASATVLEVPDTMEALAWL